MIGLGGLTWKINRRVWLNIIEVEGKKRSGGSGYRWRVGQYFVGGDINPRPRAGGDCRPPLWWVLGSGFNPRPRAGGDGCCWYGSSHGSGFNPRPRAGGDTDHQ